jgi:pimeloyl-ACP methyl ester carboxylesterase
MQRLVKRILVALVILALSGAVYEQVEASKDRRRFPQIGRSVDIGGRSLNIYCVGEANPTVVLLRGGYSWMLVQPDVGRVTRACWYDPAGMGWSEPSSGTHSSFSIASDLHKLLQRAHVTAPYVLVGHSVGGFDARAFYRLYSNEVAGMVLVDASHEDYNARIQVGNPLCPRCPRRPAVFLARVLGAVGLVRLFASEPGPAPEGMKPMEWTTIVGLQRQSKTVVAGLQEEAKVNEEQMRTAGRLGNVPLIVLTGGRTFANSDPSEAQKYAQAQHAWNTLQSELARLSSRGRQEIVENSGHMMQYEAPQVIIRAVLEIVAEVRQNGSQSASSSGTK